MYVFIDSDFSTVFPQGAWAGSIRRCERRFCPARTHVRGEEKKLPGPSLPLTLRDYPSTQICFKPVAVRDLCPEYDQLNLFLLKCHSSFGPASSPTGHTHLEMGTPCPCGT